MIVEFSVKFRGLYSGWTKVAMLYLQLVFCFVITVKKAKERGIRLAMACNMTGNWKLRSPVQTE